MTSRLNSLLLLSFISGVYGGVIKISFGLWLKDLGLELVYLGLINLVLLPFGLKILWVAFFDILKSPLHKFFGYRKGWLIFMNFILILMVAGFKFFDPQSGIASLIVYAFLFSCLAATQEAMALAYQMETLKPKEWGPSEGMFMVAYNSGLWLGGAGLLFISDFMAWNKLFFYLGCFLSFGLLAMFFIPETESKVKESKSLQETFLEPFKDFVCRNRKFIFSMIAFLALYRLQDRLLMSMLNYFFMDLGFSKTLIATGKSIGPFVMMIGALAGSWFVKKFGYTRSLMFGIIWHALSSSIFLIQSYLPPSLWLFYTAIGFEKIARGFESSVFFTYQMTFCNKKYAMTQLSILLAIDRLNGTLFSSVSGFIAQNFGWSLFFIFSLIGSLPSLLFLNKLPCEIEDEPEIGKQNN